MAKITLDKHEQDYADGLVEKMKKHQEPEKAKFREFETGCGGRVRVYSDGRIEQL